MGEPAFKTRWDESRERRQEMRREALAAGAEARSKGEGIDTCPHRQSRGIGGSLRCAWEAGWDGEDARRAARGEKTLVRSWLAREKEVEARNAKRFLDAVPKVVPVEALPTPPALPAQPARPADEPAPWMPGRAREVALSIWNFIVSEGGEWTAKGVAQALRERDGHVAPEVHEAWIVLGTLVDVGAATKRKDPKWETRYLYRAAETGTVRT